MKAYQQNEKSAQNLFYFPDWQQQLRDQMLIDLLQKLSDPNELTTWQRVKSGGAGLLWGGLAIAEGFAAGVTSETVVGGIFFGASSVYAGDKSVANIREAYSGRTTRTGFETGLADIGLQDSTIAKIDGATGLVFAAPGLYQVGKLAVTGLNRFGFFAGGRVVDASAESFSSTITTHPLEGWTPEQVVDYANKLGLSTQRDELILWSGLGRGNAGVRLSQEYAAANGGRTLEMTPGGKWLNDMELYGANSPFTQVETDEIWADVSTQMIRQASGQVRSLVGTVSPRSIYMAERSEILMNEKILGVDELNLKPRFVFGNN